jgi:hypothetical protein
VLLRFELLFDGTLGDWKLPPVSFELKEGMKLYHGRAGLALSRTNIYHPNEGNQLAVQHWSVAVATIITMGIANIHHTQKG